MNITPELINSLNDQITNSFIQLFEEAGEELDINTWSDRFDLIHTEIEDSESNPVKWTMTFEDKQDRHAHFNLHMNGEETDDFSIDT
ncbi:MAG: hypothetical protein QM726_19995 [Chitinophagaceae bacterium]